MIRRSLPYMIVVLVILALWMGLWWHQQRLGDRAVASGWILLGLSASLLLLSIRKRIYRVGWGRVAWWVRWHKYAGILAAAVFLMHIGWPIRGWFESLLAVVFVLVTVTGIALGVLSRTSPQRLLALSEDYRLECIPGLQRAVADAAHAAAVASSDFGEGSTLAEFYQRELLPYFRLPRSWMFVLFPGGRRRRELLGRLQRLDRYLGPQGLSTVEELARLIQRKDDLDYHYAVQRRLQLLYAAHAALMWVLAILIAAHVPMALRFQGGM